MVQFVKLGSTQCMMLSSNTKRNFYDFMFATIIFGSFHVFELFYEFFFSIFIFISFKNGRMCCVLNVRRKSWYWAFVFWVCHVLRKCRDLFDFRHQWFKFDLRMSGNVKEEETKEKNSIHIDDKMFVYI